MPGIVTNPTKNTPEQKFIWAVGQQESGGDPTRVNPSSGALGEWQVMPANVGPWTQQAIGHALTPGEFLRDTTAQQAVADTILGGYYKKYGPEGAAAAWYGGPGVAKDQGVWNNPVQGGPTIRQYVDQVLARIPHAPVNVGEPTGSGGLNVGGILGLPSEITGFLRALEAPVQGAMWLLDPANWARIVAGMLGLVFLGAGIVALAKAA